MATTTIRLNPVVVVNRRDLDALAAVKKPIEKPFDSKTLRVAAFSDYRVQDISLLIEFVSSLTPKPDLILYAGDDVERFQDGRNFFEQLAALATCGLCAVVGNDGPPLESDTSRIRLIREVQRVRAYIKGTNVFNVHETPLIVGDYALVGSEGAPLDERSGAMGIISYPEKAIAQHLRRAAKAVKGKRLIVVSHAPPRGVLDLAHRFGTRPIGSVALRKFLDKRRDVSLVVCGHVHSCGAQDKKLNRCRIVNAASHDDDGAPGRVPPGRIAVIEIHAGAIRKLDWHKLPELTSVAGIGLLRAEKLRQSGIRTIGELYVATDATVHSIIKCGISEAASIRNRAGALMQQEILVRQPVTLPPSSRRAYLDIETDQACTFIWLIGLHVEGEGRTYSFFANSSQDEKQMLTEFLAFASSNPDLHLLSYSGSYTEERMIARRLAGHNLSAICASRIRDMYFDVHSCAAFPVESSMGLKEIAACCGFEPRTDIDGFTAAIIYGSGNPSKRDKKKLLIYNEDDLLALKHLVLYLDTHSQGRALAAQATLY